MSCNRVGQNSNDNVIEDIIITHFINPSMFWYRVSAEFPEELLKLEHLLQRHFSLNRDKEYLPKRNEIVAVYIVSESRYCRARVEELLEFRQAPNKYMIWAIDYGKVYSTRSKFIREIPEELAQIKIENVFFGGLNDLVPATQTFDFRQYDNVMTVCEKWSPESCQLFDKIVKDAYAVEFVIQRKMKDQFFGELKVAIQTNNKLSINEVLIKSNAAIKTDNFVMILNDLKLNQRPFWLTNENDINKYNDNTLNNIVKLKKIETNYSSPVGNDVILSGNTAVLKHIEIDENEVALNKKISEWNLGNSKVSNDNIEKIRKFKNIVNEEEIFLNNSESFNQNHDNSILGIKTIVEYDMKYAEDVAYNKSSNDKKNETSFSSNMSIEKNDISVPNVFHENVNDNTRNTVNELPCEDPFNVKNLPLSKTADSNFDKKSTISNNSIDSIEIRKSAREKILDRIKNRSKALNGSPSIPKMIIPAGFDLKNLQPKKQEKISINSATSLKANANDVNLVQVQTKKLKTNSEFSVATSSSLSDSVNNFLAQHKDVENVETSNRSLADQPSTSKCNIISKLNDSSHKLNQVSSTKTESLKSMETRNRYEHRNSRSGSNTGLSDSENSSRKSKNNNSGNNIRYNSKDNNSGNISRNNQRGHRRNYQQRNDNTNNQNNNKNTKDGFEELDETCIPISDIGKDSVMVHGTIPVPINRLVEAQFTPHIHNQMEMLGHKAIYRVQQYCWPHLLRFNSLILVNGEKSGKTFAYLPAVCSLIEMEDENGDVSKDGKGPIAIIVLGTRAEAEQLHKLCKYFTRKVVFCSDQQNSAEALGFLLNPVDILICTPNGIKALEEKNKKYHWFSRDRIKHFIIENIDNYCHEKLSILSEAMDNFNIKKLDNIQIVVISRIWRPLLKSFLKLKSFNNPLICMGACIEAAVYSNTQFILKIVKKDFKVNCVLEFLQKNFYEDQKSIILCNSNEDAEYLAEKIRGISINVTLSTSQSTMDDINVIKSNWNNSSTDKRSVLICTDGILPDLSIRDAQNLIHYSLSSSWTQTCYRFSVFLKYHENKLIINDKVQVFAEATIEPAKTLFLLDESNNEQLPKLINFLDRNEIPIDGTIRKLIKRIEMEREKGQNLGIRPFCSKFLEFGKLHNISQCKGRHVLTNDDTASDDIPVNGEIKFQLISIESPTIYNVRILEHRAINTNLWHYIKQSNSYSTFFMKFNMFFQNAQNHETYFPIVKNEICVAIEKGDYHRCKILEINKIEVRGSIDYNVRAKLVDVGTTMSFKSSQLLVLPKKFAEFPFQAVELRLLGMVPYDKEEVWDKKTMSTVRTWFDTYANEKKTINTAVVEFALMNSIFVKEIIMKSELSALNMYVDKIYVKRNLIEKKMVLRDTEIENDIKIMAYDASLLIPPTATKILENLAPDNETVNTNGINKANLDSSGSEYDSEIKKSNSSDVIINKTHKNFINESRVSSVINKESWDNLIGNKFSKVIITEYKSPNNFYVRRKSSHDDPKFEKLSSKIDEFIKNGAKSILEPTIGLNCLAQCNDSYERCKVIGIASQNFQLAVTLFFVDLGVIKLMKANDIFPSNAEIVNMISFQAIQCSLVGISSKTLNGLWNNNESQHIYNKFFKDCKSLYVRPMLEECSKKTSILNYWSYKVILINYSDYKNPIQINCSLYNKGFSTKDPETEHFMDFVDFSKKDFESLSIESDSSEDEWQAEEDRPIFQFNENNPDDDCDREFDINFDEAEIEDFLESLGLPKTAKILPKDELINVDEKTKTKNVESVRITEVKKVSPKPITEKRFINMYKNMNRSQNSDEIKENTKNLFNNSKSIIEILKEKKKSMQNQLQNSSDKFSLRRIPELKDLYKIPKVIWRQTEDLICLYICAPNIEDYELKVTQTSLIFSADIESQMNVLCLNLFGSVDSVSHEIRGLSVVIRLIKTLKGKIFQWPRLTSETDKHLWLKYNYESLLKENESEENLAFTRTITNRFQKSDAEDSSESENEDYEDYNKICNAEEIYDPFEDV